MKKLFDSRMFVDEHGFTTTGMVIALLVSLSLVFSAAQVYRISSTAAHIQDVADASALTAENQVAEFMLIARTCDAVVLSMSLAGIVTTGLGVAALCTPVTARFSEQLIDAGSTNTLIEQIFDTCEDLLAGKMICGAGGGGFLQVVLKKGVRKAELQERIQSVFADTDIAMWDCELV